MEKAIFKLRGKSIDAPFIDDDDEGDKCQYVTCVGRGELLSVRACYCEPVVEIFKKSLLLLFIVL